MKKKQILRFILAAFLILIQQTNSHAQVRDIKWEPFLQHPCYKGLSVSVLNMGWSNDVKTYLWGVRIKNNYNTAVSFRYLLDVGDEKKDLTKNYYEAAYRLKPGDSLTNGDDALRGIIFKTSSSEWTVMVGDVCFDGMRCGGEDDCYADCDVSARKVNQPCGLEAHTSTKPRSGIWETKKNKMVKIELTDKGLVFTNAGVDFNFSKISEDEYEWVKGKYIHIKFSDANHFSIMEYGEVYSVEYNYEPNTPVSSYDPASDCCDVSFFEGEWTDVDKKTKVSITGNANGFTLKKQNSSILYQYTLNPILKYHYNKGKGVFLSMHIQDLNNFSCQGILGKGDYFTEAFYTRLKPIKDTVNKPKTPIVKKEEKPIVENKPVTENKTASGDCKVTGKFKVERIFNNDGLIITVRCEGGNLSMREESGYATQNEQFIATAIPPIERSIVNNSKVLGTWKGRWPYETWVSYNSRPTVGGGPMEVIYQLLENGDLIFAPTRNIEQPIDNQVIYVLFKKIR